MTIAEVIKKALDGGYKNYQQCLHRMFLDPEFWKCLGKQLNWGTDLWVGKMARLQGDKLLEMKWEIPDWQHHWHRFIDHLAEGGNAETFFKTLKQ